MDAGVCYADVDEDLDMLVPASHSCLEETYPTAPSRGCFPRCFQRHPDCVVDRPMPASGGSLGYFH